MHELTDNSPMTKKPSELELILERLTQKNLNLSTLATELNTGLQRISHYTEPEPPIADDPGFKDMVKDREDTIMERLNYQLTLQEKHLQSLEFSLRHLRAIV